MSDKGFPVIVKINLPPEVQYHSGHSIIVQGDDVGEVRQQLQEMLAGAGNEGLSGSQNIVDQANYILLRFAEYALGGAVEQDLKSGADPSTGPVETPRNPTAGSSSAPDLASPKVLAAVAKKTGKPIEELGELTKAEASALLKGGGK